MEGWLVVSVVLNLIFIYSFFGSSDEGKKIIEEQKLQIKQNTEHINNLKLEIDKLSISKITKEIPPIITKKFVKTSLINSIKAMDDKYVFLSLAANESKAYIKDSKNTSILSTL